GNSIELAIHHPLSKSIGSLVCGRPEPRAKSQEPRAKSQEPRAKSQEPRAKSQEERYLEKFSLCAFVSLRLSINSGQFLRAAFVRSSSQPGGLGTCSSGGIARRRHHGSRTLAVSCGPALDL